MNHKFSELGIFFDQGVYLMVLSLTPGWSHLECLSVMFGPMLRPA
jgi:hypothetical protein